VCSPDELVTKEATAGVVGARIPSEEIYKRRVQGRSAEARKLRALSWNNCDIICDLQRILLRENGKRLQVRRLTRPFSCRERVGVRSNPVDPRFFLTKKSLRARMDESNSRWASHIFEIKSAAGASAFTRWDIGAAMPSARCREGGMREEWRRTFK
jgi:hypothetical protein